MSRTQATHTGFPVIGNGIDTQRMQVQLDEREPFAVAMSHVASNVALEKMNFVTQRVQGSEQPAQQRSVPITPSRTDCQPKDGDFHQRSKYH